MKIFKGSIMIIRHQRKGTIQVIAKRDFYTDEEEFYPVATVSEVEGRSQLWLAGDDIPCRASLCQIASITKPKN